MIIDSLRGFERYLNLHSKFEKVFSYIIKNDVHKLEPGEYSVVGKDIYFTIWEGEGKGMVIPKLEVHDSYIDIHILLEGNETIGFRDRSRCNGDGITYDPEKDIAFLEEMPENFINLAPDNLAIIFPYDAHAPLIGEGKIKKAVFKVKM
ncbi:MAG TPA: YhcH/YjgK/YiaL family protein [Bacteroidales bacterium]|nr:YhcH/YjgK/YiaL family protein [Rikenellaceae bacterium]HON54542.1 YhcH/YjgK/YiaL family protein [Bacteroidales bacterium]HRR48774.1 YhcH/YjgK/YiaL family protein [Bacteroidales bacterium]HRT33524.1 YhcH/YjgK/YiaL family protein [Bacteroidales bacterium]HRT83637.1 YhcH/YjgK/YiaL family protein [Bacteroidales bacterium]